MINERIRPTCYLAENVPGEQELVDRAKKYGHFGLQPQLDQVCAPELSDRIRLRKDILNGSVDIISDFDKTFIQGEARLNLLNLGVVRHSIPKLARRAFLTRFSLSPTGESRLALSLLESKYIDRNQFSHYRIVYGSDNGKKGTAGVELNQSFLQFCRDFRSSRNNVESAHDPVHVVILSRNHSYVVKATIAKFADILSTEGILIDGVIANDIEYISEENEAGRMRWHNERIEVTSQNKSDYTPGGIPLLVDNDDLPYVSDQVNAVNIQSQADYGTKMREIMLSILRKRYIAVSG